MSALTGKTITVDKITVAIKEKIGEGGYAYVYRCVDSSGNQYALKYVNCLTPERYEQFCEEANILKSLPAHPNIVKLYGSHLDSKALVIVLLYEYCPATAIGILSKRKMTKEEVLIFFTACASATAFLHSQSPPVIHRDLKPENLLVGMDGTPKLCDFGSATRKTYQVQSVKEINIVAEEIERNTTQNYRSPEMVDLFKRVEIGTPSDVWALGCTLYKLIYREDLYKPDERMPILQGKLKVPSEIDPNFMKILQACIQVDPKKRLTAKQITDFSKSIRGDNDKIAYTVSTPKSEENHPQVQQKANKEANGTERKWTNPLNYMKEQYRSLVSTGVSQWAIKATFASNDPPESKYVRRVLLASIRHTEMSPYSLVKFLLNERPWKDDIRIAAKSLYLILLLVQYETSLSEYTPITVNTDQVISYFTKDSNNDTMVSTITHIGTVLRTKIMLHSAHKELEGNLAIGSNQISPGLEEDLTRYLETISVSSMKLLRTAKSAKDFSVVVMSHPAIEEVSNANKLLSYLLYQKPPSDSSQKSLSHSLSVLTEASQLPFLQTSVNYPDSTQPPQPPFQRFVVKP